MFLIIRIINTIDKKVVVLLNADWHIKVQPVIIHNRWYNKVYSCVKILYGISEVIVDDSSNIKYRSRFKRTDKLHKCKRFFGK